MDGGAARDQKVAAAKKKLKKYQKKKAVGSVDSINTTHINSSESVTPTGDRRNSVASDSGSVRTEGTDGKGQETIAIAEDNISATNTNPDVVENQASQTYSDYSTSATSLGLHNSLVEGLQPIFQPHGQQSQPNLLSKQIDLTTAESILSPTANSAEESLTYEALFNIYHKQRQDLDVQRQAIALLVDEKNALASQLEKYSEMADRYKRSEELLEEGQLLVDALRRKNAELEEKIRNGEDRLKEAGEQKENIMESLQLQNTRVEQLEKDNKQLISQLNTKDSIIEQLTQEKANARSVSDEVEALQKTLQDKEDRCEALEIELSNLRHKLTNAEQQLSENTEKLSETEQMSRDTQTKFESMTKEIQQLTNERNELMQKVEKISGSLETKESEALALSEQVSSDASIIEKLNLDRNNFSEDLQIAQSQNSKLTKRIKDLTTKIEGLSNENRDLIAQLTELREKVVKISNDKLQLVEEVDKEKSRATRLEQEVNKLLESVRVYSEEEKKSATTTNGTTREIVDENQNNQPLSSEAISISSTSQEGLKQLLFKERQKTLNLELQLKRMFETYNNNIQVMRQIDNQTPSSSNLLNLSPPNSTSRRYSFSQFSGDFETGKCSGCIGEVIVV